MSNVVLGLSWRSNLIYGRPSFHPAQTSDRLWFDSEALRCVTITRCPKIQRGDLRTHCMGVAESTAAVQSLLSLALAGDFDGLLEYVPDAAVEHALQRKKIFRRSERGDCVSFPEMAVMSQPDFSIGAHAMRGLIFSRPSSIELLSSMRLSAQSAVHRCSVTATSGEEMILSIAMCREERHKPSYRGFTTEMAWAVSAIRGEAAVDEEGRCPDEPDPRWGPESVVCGQLHALRQGNLEQAASFTGAAWEDGPSPAVHARDVLSEHYAPLVYHGGHQLAGTTQVSASRAYVFAGVELRGMRKQSKSSSNLYTWALSLHRGGTTWLIDGIEKLLNM